MELWKPRINFSFDFEFYWTSSASDKHCWEICVQIILTTEIAITLPLKNSDCFVCLFFESKWMLPISARTKRKSLRTMKMTDDDNGKIIQKDVSKCFKMKLTSWWTHQFPQSLCLWISTNSIINLSETVCKKNGFCVPLCFSPLWDPWVRLLWYKIRFIINTNKISDKE